MDVDKLKQNAHVLIPACLAVLSSLYLLNKSKSNEKKGLKEIPFPSNSISWPLFGIYTYKKKELKIFTPSKGHLLSLGDVPSKQMTQWHKTTGPIYKINMGNQLWIMISDPFLAHDIFVKAGSSTSSRPYHRFTTDMYNMNDKYSVFFLLFITKY